MTTEHEHPALAIRHIVCGEERVRKQGDLVDGLVRRGHDTAVAKVLLNTIQTSLDQMPEHRRMIERAIANQLK